MLRFLAFGHGIYYFITGLWALIDIQSFQRVTGEKTDLWLVKMVGLLTVSISLLLFIAAFRKRITLESFVLIIASCMSYLLIDVIYTLKHTILPVYLGDVFVELLLIIFWFIWLGKGELSR